MDIAIADTNKYLTMKLSESGIKCRIYDGTKCDVLLVNADNIRDFAEDSDGIILLSGKSDMLPEKYLFAEHIFCTLQSIEKFVGKACEETDSRIQSYAGFYLRYIGMNDTLKGFSYLQKLIEMTFYGMTLNDFYMRICSENRNRKNVERAMRYAAESAWDSGNTEKQTEIFGYSVSPDKGRPTTKELASVIAQHIRNNIMGESGQYGVSSEK